MRSDFHPASYAVIEVWPCSVLLPQTHLRSAYSPHCIAQSVQGTSLLAPQLLLSQVCLGIGSLNLFQSLITAIRPMVFNKAMMHRQAAHNSVTG